MTGRRDVLLVLLLTAVAAGALYASQQWQSVTYDEPELLYSGLRALYFGDYSASPHPPVTKLLGALPVWAILRPPMPPDPFDDWLPTVRARTDVRTAWEEAKALLFHTPGLDATETIRLARIPTVFLYVLLVLSTWAWSRELYGPRAGFLTFVLIATCPVLLSSGQYLSTDIGGATFGTLGLYLASRAAHRPTGRRFALAGVAFGLALGSRYQPLALTVGTLGLLLLLGLLDRRHPAPDDGPLAPTLDLARARFGGAVLLLSALVTLLAIYGFFAYHHFASSVHFLSTSIGPLNAFWFTIDGETSKAGWLTYFPRVLAYKLPPTFLLLVLLALVSLVPRRPRRAEWWVVLPALALLALAIKSRINYGVRHVLPVLPPLYVLAGRLTADRPRAAYLLVPLALLGSVDVLRTHPDYQAHVSRAAGGTDNGWKRLGDSSLDTGQGLVHLREDSKAHPGGYLLSYFGTGDPNHYGIPYRYLFGQHDRQRLKHEPRDVPFPPKSLAVSVCFLHLGGLYATPGAFHWLKAHPPDRHAGHAILIWDLESRPDWYGRMGLIYIESSLSAYVAEYQGRLRGRAIRLFAEMRRRGSRAGLDATLAELDARAARLGTDAGTEYVFLTAAALRQAGYPRAVSIRLFRRLLAGDYGPLPPELEDLTRRNLRTLGAGSGSGSD